MLTKSESEKYWNKLSLAYVTEESDDPDNPNGIIEHKLPWRSPSRFFCMHTRARSVVVVGVGCVCVLLGVCSLGCTF